MHPIDKKTEGIAKIILTFAVIVAAICLFRSLYYFFALMAFSIIAIANTMKIKHSLVLFGVFVSISFPVILGIDYFFAPNYSNVLTNEGSHYTGIFIVSAIILVIPLFVTYIYFYEIVKISSGQKKHFAIIDKSPYLICKAHNCKTKEYSIMGYKSIRCRKDKRCLNSNKITFATNLVGLIGVIETGKLTENDYSVTLWDHRVKKIRNGDYDIIEIHNNKEINNYDFVISKIITFLNNETSRFKPINEVLIRLVGEVPITENTKRLLEKHFSRLEYIKIS